MGFFDRFFKARIEEKEIKSDELKDYTEGLLKEKFTNINQNIEEIYSNLEKTKSRLSENLKTLRNAELQNKDVPTRALQLMEGNREAYIRKINNFIEQIELPNIESYSLISEFCNNFDSMLNELNKSTYKGFEVMREFFYNQATEIAMGIKDINLNIKNLRQLVANKELSKIEYLRELIGNIEKYSENKEKIKESIKEKESSIEELGEKIEAVKRRFEEIKKSNEYENYKKTNDEKEKLLERIKVEKDEVIQLFAVLEKSLKKYKRGSLNERLIDQYLEDSSEALLKDTELNIVLVLAKLKESIEQNKIELKDKKKERTLEIIRRLTKEFLDNKRFDLEQHARTKIILNDRLSKNNINNLYQEEKYKMEHFNQKLEDENKKLEALKKEKEGLDIVKIKEDIKKEFLELFSIKLNF